MRQSRAPTRPGVGVLFALGVALVLACNRNAADEEDDNQFRDDVIWCEEAAARLERCCPNFDAAKIECKYYYSFDSGCGSSTTRRTEPALSKEESRCIHDTSCDAIVAQGVCLRAEQSGAARSTVTTTSSSSSSSSGTTSGFPSSSTTSSSSGTSGRTTGNDDRPPGPVCP